MTTLIPPALRKDAPPGERAVFEALRDHPATADWVAWHGLAIREHETQSQGEADFVIVIPGAGMLVIEVKSHQSVSVSDDNLWQLGRQAPTPRSPYDQADANRFSIESWLQTRSFPPTYPIWSAVWFTHVGGEIVARLEQRIDAAAGSTLTRADLDPSRMVDSLRAVLRHGREKLEQGRRKYQDGWPDAQDIARIRATLTPKFAVRADAATRREERERDLQRATEQQEDILRYVGSNKRLLITGPAGTGKTNIAIRAAQQQANRDKGVLLTCFNKFLEADLQHRLRDREDIAVGRVHGLMLALTGLTPPQDAGDDWWNGTLPAATLAITKAPGFTPEFTCLVVDESQDLTRSTMLDVLDSLLVDGLAGSRCIVTGDFSRQDIFATPSGPDPLEQLLARIPDLVQVTIDKNVRQSPQLVDCIDALLDDEIYADAVRSPEHLASAQVVQFVDEADQQSLLFTALETLLDEEQFRPDEIVVLSPRRDSAAARAAAPIAVQSSTIHAFKGLERPAVIITDVTTSGHQWDDVLYVGLTRATDRLIVLTDSAELASRWAPANLHPSSDEEPERQ